METGQLGSEPIKKDSNTDSNRDRSGILQEQVEHKVTEARGPVIDISVLDSIRALQREGAPNLFNKLVTIYLTQASAIIISLSSAVIEKNAQDIFHLAHKLKSSSANVGAVYLSSLLKNLETLGRQSKTEGTANLFTAIEKEFEAVRDSLEELMSGAAASR
jgi:two-component system, sensor histidine kinase and response regulator